MENLNYGIIGNCKSAALISDKASIDWCCLPDFNSSSIFARLLDSQIGGNFAIIVDPAYKISQKYLENTNIMVTRFQDGNNIFEVNDFMPRYHEDDKHYYCPPDIIRYIKYISGKPCFKVNFNPKLNYARNTTDTILEPFYIKSYTTSGEYESIYLYSDLDLEKVYYNKTIQITKNAFFLLTYNQKLLKQTISRIHLKYERTKVYWLNWVNDITTYKNYNDEIVRSALVLKLLSYQNSGAILAAITTSLPETIGEVRNWDYRYCWIRDAGMIIRVLRLLGQSSAAKRFLNFIIEITPSKDEKIQIMYGIRGEKKLTEQTLDHLAGYENSKPVRIGNAAYKQKQHDIYGVLMDVILQNFQNYQTSLETGEELWTIVRSVVRSVQGHWREPDKGIWEIRTNDRHFTFSKVLCWVAIDRGVKIARILEQHEYAKEWVKTCKEIRTDILENAWNEELQAFTQAYDNTDMDAANLLIEYYGFLNADDPRYISTVKAIYKELSFNELMYRYRNRDDFGEPSSSFTICTFWLISSLYKIGEKEKAKSMFHQVLKYSNHLGLFSEDIDFKTKRLLGNFPQGYSHLALIETAILMSGGPTTENELLKSLK